MILLEYPFQEVILLRVLPLDYSANLSFLKTKRAVYKRFTDCRFLTPFFITLNYSNLHDFTTFTEFITHKFQIKFTSNSFSFLNHLWTYTYSASVPPYCSFLTFRYSFISSNLWEYLYVICLMTFTKNSNLVICKIYIPYS